MAARGGRLWEAGTRESKQGCPSCCSRAAGWGWNELRQWRKEGKEPEQATMLHVLCGACSGIDKDTQQQQRTELQHSLRAALKLTLRQTGGRKARTYVIGEGRKEIGQMIAAAQRALAKPAGTAFETEEKAMRRWLAGDLPSARGSDATQMTIVARRMTEAVRRAQRAAAQLRRAWQDASKQELARRAERDGNAEGKRWKGVGMEEWKWAVGQRERGEVATDGAATEESARAERGERHGWTMASALIAYQTRKLRAQKKRREADGDAARDEATADGDGRGLVVFDLETTQMIEDGVDMEEMEISCACAAWVPMAPGTTGAEALEKAEWHTWWHKEARAINGEHATRGSMEGLLEWMDKAALIVCYNGHAFDMRVLTRHYDGDNERQERHARKLLDPIVATTRAAGRRLRLSHLLRLNGQKGKAGAGCDAPGMWQEGKLDALERYCKRDVEALAELALRDEVRVPGGSTREATVWHVLRKQGGGSGAGNSNAQQSDGAGEESREHAAATPGTAAQQPQGDGGTMQMERTPNARPSWGELLEEAESRGGDIAGAAPPRLGFQSATHAEVLSIEELIEALDKVGMYTHTSKTAVGRAKDMWTGANNLKPAGIWYATGGTWLRYLTTDLEPWLEDAVYVWEVEIDRTRVRVLGEENDTWQCVSTYGVGEGVDATLDWTALARDGYSGVEVTEYHQDIRYEQEWYLAIDIESGVVWDEDAVQGAWPIAVRRPDGSYYTKVRGAGSAAKPGDIRLSDAEAAAALKGEEGQGPPAPSPAPPPAPAPASSGQAARRTPRKCTTVQSYSQTATRAPRRPRELAPYLERGATRCRRGTKREAVVIGALTVERIVGGRYEWRDAEYAAIKGPRKRFWDKWHAG